MQCIIFAGGLGTRLRPHTHNIPKPMIEINSKPFLEYLINFYKKYKIRDFLLLTGYLGEKIEDYFGNGEKFGINIQYSKEKEPLGTGGALKNAENYLKDTFILANGDTYLDIDVLKLIKHFKKGGKLAALVVKKSNNFDINNIEIKDNKIIDYAKNTKDSKLQYVDAGMLIAGKNIIDLFPKKQKFSFEEEIFPKLIKNNQIAPFITEKEFYDMGTQERLEQIKKVLK